MLEETRSRLIRSQGRTRGSIIRPFQHKRTFTVRSSLGIIGQAIGFSKKGLKCGDKVDQGAHPQRRQENVVVEGDQSLHLSCQKIVILSEV